jgi:uncharacterized protein (TIGR02246 family)
MQLPRLVAVVVLGLTLAGCSGNGGGAQPQEFTKEDNSAVRQLVTDFLAAYNSKDPVKAASFFSGAGVLMPPNSSTLRGEESIRGFYKERFAEGATELTFEPRDLNGVGTTAMMTGSFAVRVVPPDGKPESHDRGKSLWIAEKLAGKWMFQYQMWSSDLPPPVCPPPAADEKAEKK